MASIRKRSNRPNKPWQARYRDLDGVEHSQHFTRKIDAERFLTNIEHAKLSNTYVSPADGLVTFKEAAEAWRAVQVQHRPSTAAHVETQLRRHAYPFLGDRPIGRVRPSEIQAWVSSRAQVLAPGTVEVAYRYVAAVFKAAVADRRIASSPCVGIKLPRIEHVKVTPLTLFEVERLIGTIPDRYRALVVLGAGTGLRQGEAFGVTADRVDFLRRSLTIDRQLLLMPGGEPRFGPPKTNASNRTVPLPDLVLDALSAHMAAYPVGPDGLIFTNDDGVAVRRTRFSEVWRPAVVAAELPAGTTFHSLRHHYASLLIRHGESVKTVQARLGHASATQTLDTYAHLWPDSDDRTRAAVDDAWRAAPADLTRTNVER
jgi:integrase